VNAIKMKDRERGGKEGVRDSEKYVDGGNGLFKSWTYSQRPTDQPIYPATYRNPRAYD